VSGTVEISVEHPGAATCHYAIGVSRSAVTISEQPAADAAARIVGSDAEWIEALGPAADRSGLDISGDERLATLVLDGVSAAVQRASRAA
jgi:hypothetical protein